MKKEIISFPNSKYNVHTWKDVSLILMLLTNLAQNLKIYSRWSDSYWTDKEINELWLSLSCFLRIPADAKLVGRDAIICQLFVLQFSFNFFFTNILRWSLFYFIMNDEAALYFPNIDKTSLFIVEARRPLSI